MDEINAILLGTNMYDDGYNQALEDFANALIDGEQNEEFVYNIKKIVERLREGRKVWKY